MRIYQILLFSVLICITACKSNINPEIKEEMEAFVKMRISEEVLIQNHQRYKAENFNIDITDIEEKRVEINGEKYGTYTADFEYTFQDEGVPVSVTGVAVFSHDASITHINGEEGIILENINASGIDQDVKKSKYNFTKSIY